MPNASPESLLLQAVKLLIRSLFSEERAVLRPWLLAFDVQGHARRGPHDQ